MIAIQLQDFKTKEVLNIFDFSKYYVGVTLTDVIPDSVQLHVLAEHDEPEDPDRSVRAFHWLDRCCDASRVCGICTRGDATTSEARSRGKEYILKSTIWY